MAPESGFHWVIDSPELVRRVDPPRITMANTMTATTNNQIATGRARPDLRNDVMRRCRVRLGTTEVQP